MPSCACEPLALMAPDIDDCFSRVGGAGAAAVAVAAAAPGGGWRWRWVEEEDAAGRRRLSVLATVVAFAVLLLLLLLLPLLLVPVLPVLDDVMGAVEAACADASERVSSWLLALLRWRAGGIVIL